MDLGFCPDERLGASVVCGDEGIDVLPGLGDGGEGGACEQLPAKIENQISTWLSQEARVGVKWKWTLVWRSSQRSFFGLWCSDYRGRHANGILPGLSAVGEQHGGWVAGASPSTLRCIKKQRQFGSPRASTWARITRAKDRATRPLRALGSTP
jgi:hypothetical protein